MGMIPKNYKGPTPGQLAALKEEDGSLSDEAKFRKKIEDIQAKLPAGKPTVNVIDPFADDLALISHISAEASDPMVRQLAAAVLRCLTHNLELS